MRSQQLAYRIETPTLENEVRIGGLELTRSSRNSILRVIYMPSLGTCALEFCVNRSSVIKKKMEERICSFIFII